MSFSEELSADTPIGDGRKFPRMTVDQARSTLIAAFDRASRADKSYIVGMVLNLVGSGEPVSVPNLRKEADAILPQRSGRPYLRLVQADR